MLGSRAALRRMRAEWCEWSGANARARLQLDGTRAAILMYHRVLPAAIARERAVEPGMFVTPETFRLHLECLMASFRVLPLSEVVSRLAQQRSLPPGACALTFDDGWRDNLEYAFPELAYRGLPATVFLVSERVGTRGGFWPDEVSGRLAPLGAERRRAVAQALGVPGDGATPAILAALKALPHVALESALERVRAETPLAADAVGAAREGADLLDWNGVERMAAHGIEMEAHGATHAILTALPDEAAAAELRTARETLRARGHGAHALLAYPSGGHDARVQRLARAAGYRAAVTTERGVATPGHDPMALPRLGLHDDVSRSHAEFRRLVPGPGASRRSA